MVHFGSCTVGIFLLLVLVVNPDDKTARRVRHRKNRYRTTTPELPPVLYSEHGDSVTTLLGENVELRCTVLGYKAGQHTVSWTRRTEDIETPTALTFGSMVFISSMRFSVHTEPLDTWVLRVANVTTSDGGKYECHLNSDNIPIKMSISLNIRVPKITVLDGFGRKLNNQFYEVGSSLEICCQLDILPSFWDVSHLDSLIVWQKIDLNQTIYNNPREGISIQTERNGIHGYSSRLAITQASKLDSGNYSCGVENYVNASLTLHVFQDKILAAMAASDSASSTISIQYFLNLNLILCFLSQMYIK